MSKPVVVPKFKPRNPLGSIRKKTIKHKDKRKVNKHKYKHIEPVDDQEKSWLFAGFCLGKPEYFSLVYLKHLDFRLYYKHCKQTASP